MRQRLTLALLVLSTSFLGTVFLRGKPDEKDRDKPPTGRRPRDPAAEELVDT
jgi:hypothetical protein